MKLKPPTFKSGKSYERYKQELLAWREVTDISKEKQGISVALSLPEDDESGIREKVFDEVDLAELKAEAGFEKLVEFLDKQLKKDDLSDCLEKFEDFEDFERASGQTIQDYKSKFDQKYNKIVKLRMTLPAPVLAFKLLRKAKITREEKLLVLTGLDYTKQESMYDQAKESLKKFIGEHASAELKSAIKVEPTFLTEEEAYAAGYVKRPQGGLKNWKPQSEWKGNGKTGWRGNYNKDSRRSGGPSKAGQRNVNPKGLDGKPILCSACGSFRHLIRACPDSWENRSEAHVVDTVEGEEAVLFTGYNKASVQQLGVEARNCAVLDCACSSTVCGENWLAGYLASLEPQDREKVVRAPGEKVFKFGGGEKLKSKGAYHIPAEIAGRSVSIKTDVVESDIPLLLSKDAMKKAKVKLDLENDTARIFDVDISLNHTSSGHYCVPIDKSQETKVESVCAVNLSVLSEKDRYQAILKLHRQFAHPPVAKLRALMEDAGVWKDEYRETLQLIHNNCELCKVYSVTPPRPAVALPMASRFNQMVAMDLKKWKEKWILHLIDMWSRLTVSQFIKRKKPAEVIDQIMMKWVGVGFGVMEGILHDNGGEFHADEIREVASILNINVCTTAAESPFQNGLCERNHAVIDMMLIKLEEQYPETSLDVLLAWANNAKNSLQMWHGFSSFQLVLGRNPNLPNIMCENLPALQGTTASETLAKHLNGLHAARQSFIATEADERIRRALRSKMRASECVYAHGDKVYYKREGHNKWLGPGKVVFQDGKVIFVRHGGSFVRVSPNRLMKAGNEFCQADTAIGQQDHPQGDVSTNSAQASVDIPEPEVEEMIGLPQGVASHETAGGSEVRHHDVEREDTRREPEQPVAQKLKKNDKIQYKTSADGQWIEAAITGRAGKSTGKYHNRYNIKEDGGEEKSLDLNKVEAWQKVDEVEEVNIVLIPKSRHGEERCMQAKQIELDKLKSFGTYEMVPDVGQVRISTTWVIWDKGSEVRARLVARGFEDEATYRKDSPTVSKSAVRIILTVAALKGWPVKTTDIKSAFLQGKKMDREVYISPPKEANAAEDQIWKLKHCLYGLNDAARQFYQSVVEKLKELGCVQSSMDPAMFYKVCEGQIVGIVACHIDDFLHAGNHYFDVSVMEKLRERFLAGKLEMGQFRYIGFEFKQTNGKILVDQNQYIQDMENGAVSPDRAKDKDDDLRPREYTLLRQLVGRLNWAVQGSRPDFAFEMIDLSTKLKKGKVSDLMRAIKVIRKLKEGEAVVKFSSLDPNTWRIVAFTDASHANLEEVGSVGSHVIILVDKDFNCCPVVWRSNKIKRVVRSTLAAEALSLQEGLEDALYIREMMKELLGRMGPIIAIVDNKSVVEAIHSTKMVEDKRLRIDLAAIKETLEKEKDVLVKWCPGSEQLANCMTKRGSSPYDLLAVLQSGKLPHKGYI